MTQFIQKCKSIQGLNTNPPHPAGSNVKKPDRHRIDPMKIHRIRILDPLGIGLKGETFKYK